MGRGRKRDSTHKRFIIWTCQQKRVVQSEHGKVHQFWMCYTNPFTFTETWAGFEVSHSYPFGPIWLCHCSQMVWRCMRSSNRRVVVVVGNYLFIAPVALACWLRGSFLPRLVGECRAQHAGPWPQESTLFMLCVNRSSVSTGAGNLPGGDASCCWPPTWPQIWFLVIIYMERMSKVSEVLSFKLLLTVPLCRIRGINTVTGQVHWPFLMIVKIQWTAVFQPFSAFFVLVFFWVSGNEIEHWTFGSNIISKDYYSLIPDGSYPKLVSSFVCQMVI